MGEATDRKQALRIPPCFCVEGRDTLTPQRVAPSEQDFLRGFPIPSSREAKGVQLSHSHWSSWSIIWLAASFFQCSAATSSFLYKVCFCGVRALEEKELYTEADAQVPSR